jgi:hypothetical protein
MGSSLANWLRNLPSAEGQVAGTGEDENTEMIVAPDSYGLA